MICRTRRTTKLNQDKARETMTSQYGERHNPRKDATGLLRVYFWTMMTCDASPATVNQCDYATATRTYSDGLLWLSSLSILAHSGACYECGSSSSAFEPRHSAQNMANISSGVNQ